MPPTSFCTAKETINRKLEITKLGEKDVLNAKADSVRPLAPNTS
jgi:hypothetical protein